MRDFAKNIALVIAVLCGLSITEHYSPEVANLAAAGLLGFCIGALVRMGGAEQR